MRSSRLGLTAAAFVLVAVACSGGDSANDTTTSSATVTTIATTTTVPEPQGLTVTSTEYAFSEVPASVQEGLVHAQLTNTGAEVHQAAVLRLKDGVTPDQIIDAANDSSARDVLKLVEADGGPNNAPPGGGVSSGTVALAAGSYVLACLIPAADGELHAAKGMVSPFTVTANPSGPPDTTLAGGVGDITASDFSYTYPPGLTSGGVFTFVNTGAQPHELAVFLVPEGARIGQAREYFDAIATGKAPPTDVLPPTPLGGVTPLAPFGHAQVELALEPGHYAFVCFLTDPTTGQSHETLGSFQAITIEE